MEPPPISVVKFDDGLIWQIGINRPEKRNAVDGPTGALLAKTLIDFDKDGKSRVAVLHGNGYSIVQPLVLTFF